MTTALLGGTAAPEALQLIAGRALELAAADYTIIALPSDPDAPPEDVEELRVAVSAGLDAASIVGRLVPVRGSTMGDVFTDHLPRSVPHLAFDLANEFGPALALPLGAGDSIAGVLLTIRVPGSPIFDDEELQVVLSFADQAALALQRAEVQLAQRELEVLADRDRIARDLHDHVIQRLFAIGLAMQGTHRRAKAPVVAARLSEHIDQLQGVIHEIRSAIFDLHAEPDAAPGLRSAVSELVGEITADAGLRTSVRISGPVDVVPADLAQHAQAVVREAVSNAVRHSGARELTVTVSVGDELAIDVVDDGVGMPVGVARSGLHNLSERAVAAGGALTVTDRDGGGTRVVWRAPLPS